MSLLSLVKNFVRPHAAPQAKTSAAGPMIAWSGVGQPKWTPRRYEALAEEGFRKNVIAYRCVMQIATASAAIPWLLYDDEGHEVDRHPLLDLLQHPNPLQDGVTFLESLYAYLEISGNAYIEAVKPNNNGEPFELYILRPDRMKVIPGPAGLPQGYQYTVNGQVTSWPADPITGASNILHLKRFHPLDDWYGMPPMEAALVSIDQHNAAGAWNQALLNQGARPSGALVYAPKDGPATLTDDQMQRLREEISQLYQGSRNAGRPMVLEGGLDWREMSLSPKDMDWLAGRNIAARDIAQAFGVPSQLVGIPDAQTYSNMAEARMAFYEETVLPLVTRVIAGVDHWLTPMFDARLALDFDPDQISALTPRRDAQWSKLQNAAFLTRNEKREAAGYGPVPGGDAEDENDGDPNSGADDNPHGLAPGNGGATVTPLASAWRSGKFNAYHDPDNGQFTSGPGGSSDDDKPDDSGDTGPSAPQPTDGNIKPVADVQPASDKPDYFNPNNLNPPIPAYKQGVINPADWKDINQQLADMQKSGDITPAEAYAYRATFAAEGGMTPDGNTVAGITQKDLSGFLDDIHATAADPNDPDHDAAQKLSNQFDNVTKPGDLNADDVPAVYKYLFDNEYFPGPALGGSAALNKVGDPYAAAALADTMFRNGEPAGSSIAQQAINDVYRQTKQPPIAADGIFGTESLNAYSNLAQNPDTNGPLLDALAGERASYLKDNGGLAGGDIDRIQYFRFLKERSGRGI